MVNEKNMALAVCKAMFFRHSVNSTELIKPNTKPMASQPHCFSGLPSLSAESLKPTLVRMLNRIDE